ncbi:hypothetical protein DFH07DRAFT_730185, partial [Mycena maculata]
HQHWYIRCVIILVAFLHTRHQVSFRACGLLLTCLSFIFLRLPGHLLTPEHPMPRTLKTVFSNLGLQNDKFTQHIVCHQCHRLFDRRIPSDTLCPDCNIALFQPATRQLFQSVISTIAETPAFEPTQKPHLVAPIQLLSDGLREFFQRPGMVAAVNSWKVRPQVRRESRTIHDGEVWKNIKGHDGQKFFFGRSSEREIRIGTTFSLDCNHDRYRAENLILNGMPPGPTEPTADQLQQYLKVVVDDLILLYEQGIFIKTPEYPDGMGDLPNRD